jgi:Fe2+ or Zn2+ uptake regulation protein
MANVREKEQFLRFLRGRGQRVTGKISRATVYRNLDLLVESGLARKQRLGSRGFLYEHMHSGQQHDHLVCTGCGRVVEFVSPGIAALQAEICRAHGFLPARHTLQIAGLCNRCAEGAVSDGLAAAPVTGGLAHV